jgi:ribosomal protein S18 acetylase RimI-like enzyme
MLTLVIFQLPSGIRAHIEDVVVDIELRNKGIALALMKTALQSAQKAGAKGVTLTSHSSRLSAIGLYESLGFKKWDTNMFYYQFDQPITF